MNRVALIVIVSIIAVAGITILILWLTGVLFKSKHANDSISNTKESFTYYPEYFQEDNRPLTTKKSLEQNLKIHPIYIALTKKDVINIAGKTKETILADFKNAFMVYKGQETKSDTDLHNYVCDKNNRKRFSDFLINCTYSIAGLILLSDLFLIVQDAIKLDGNILPHYSFDCGENDEADVCNEQNVTKVIVNDGPPIDLEKLTFKAVTNKSSLDKVIKDLEKGKDPDMDTDMEDIEFVDKTKMTLEEKTYYYNTDDNILSTTKDTVNTNEKKVKQIHMSKEQFEQLIRKYMEFISIRSDITYQVMCTEAGKKAVTGMVAIPDPQKSE